MVDEERLKIMTGLARFENGKGGRELQIRSYSLREYLLLALVRTFFLTTIGFAGLVALAVMGNLTYLLDHIVGVDIRALVLFLGTAYIGMLAFYMAVALITSYVRYKKAGERVRKYEKELRRLDKALRRTGA